MKKVFQNIVLLIFISLVCLILFQVLIKLADQKNEFFVDNYEFNYSVKLNSDLYRDDEFIKFKPNNTFRIFIIGDSFVYGSGVKQNETIDKFLEKKINFDPDIIYEVFSLGQPGIATNEYIKIAEKFNDYDPNLVIYSLYVDNDFIPLGWDEQNKSFFETFKQKIFNSKLYLMLQNALSKCIFGWVENFKIDPKYKELACQGRINPWLLKRGAVGDNQNYYTTIVDSFSKGTSKNDMLQVRDMFDVPFVILINPSKIQLSTRYYPELKKLGFQFEEDEVINRDIQDSIIKLAKSENIEYIDILENMDKNVEYYHVIDDHYNSKGNEFVADLIKEKINS